jgi:hypothetical protein
MPEGQAHHEVILMTNNCTKHDKRASVPRHGRKRVPGLGAMLVVAGALGGTGCGAPALAAGSQPGFAPTSEAQGTVVGAAVPIFADALAPGWSDWSWADHSLSNTSPVANGLRSVSVAFSPWSALQFLRPGLSLEGLGALEFDVNGGATDNPAILAYLVKNGTVGARVAVGARCDGQRIPAQGWTHCRVPLADLGFTSGTVDGVQFQEGSGRQLPTLFMDGVTLTGAGSPPAGGSSSSGSSSSSGGAAVGTAAAATAWLFRDAVDPAWVDGSWARHDPDNRVPVLSGTRSMSVSLDGWTGVAFAHPGFATAGRTTLTLWVNGGGGPAPAVMVRALVGGTWTTGTLLAPWCSEGIRPNVWTRCDVPLTSVMPSGAVVTNLAFQEARGIQVPTFYVDDIGFDVGGASPVAPARPVVTVTPASASTVAGGTVAFAAQVANAANTGVVWSVAEGASAGTINASGRFAASSLTGTFRVVATSVVDNSVQGTANVTVSAPANGGGGGGGSGTGTTVPAGNVVTQTWTQAGSPFRVQGDITVPAGSTLTVQPGVTVLFMGHHRMTVVGALDARGTAAAPILFTAADPVAGWYGLRIWNPSGPAGASPGHQYVENCVLEYAVTATVGRSCTSTTTCSETTGR